AVVVERLIDGASTAAGHAEDKLDARLFQHAHNRFGDGNLRIEESGCHKSAFFEEVAIDSLMSKHSCAEHTTRRQLQQQVCNTHQQGASPMTCNTRFAMSIALALISRCMALASCTMLAHHSRSA